MINRQTIYYWKCDRPSAFFALNGREEAMGTGEVEALLLPVLERYFKSSNIQLRPGSGQGNHLTYLVTHGTITRFVRLENGPEEDDFMEIEAKIITEIQALGIPAPVVYAVDATRREVPFAYQVLEYLKYPDLNELLKTDF